MSLPRTQQAPVIRQSPDRILNDAQRDSNVIRRSVNAVPDVNSAKMAAVTFAAGGTQRIQHRLGRVPTEFRAVWITGGYGAFFIVSADNAFVVMQSQNVCTATFRFS